MEQLTPIQRFDRAVSAGDAATARQVWEQYPRMLDDAGLEIDDFVADAIDQDDTALLELLVGWGADINRPQYRNAPESCLCRAAGNGAKRCVQWLLDHGAVVNHQVDGITRCFPLTDASYMGHLEIVKILIAHGAVFNYVWKGRNPLSLAMAYGQQEIVDYLRSKGALLPEELGAEDTALSPPGERVSSILPHITEFFGSPESLSLDEIAAGTPPIRIHFINSEVCKVVVTEGMSSEPMQVPTGGEGLQYAELIAFLPPDWPTDQKALADPNFAWPIEWLRRLARFPHENETWVGMSAVFTNEDPPEPLAPNTKMTSLLLIKSADEFGTLPLENGEQIVFYHLLPLYTEEYLLERSEGIAALLQRFEAHSVSRIIDPNRRNVVASG